MKPTNTQRRLEGDYNQEDLNVFTNIATILALMTLWPGKTFHPRQAMQATQHVHRFLMRHRNKYDAYFEFCQRILLTRQHITEHPEWLSGTPAFWFFDKSGFALSAGWFQEMEEKRKKDPLHLARYKALAEALLEMSEDASTYLFDYWINWFRISNADEELSIFLIFLGRDQSLNEMP